MLISAASFVLFFGRFSFREKNLSLAKLWSTFTYCFLLYRICWNFQFDDAIAEAFDCEVHSFDPRLVSICNCIIHVLHNSYKKTIF